VRTFGLLCGCLCLLLLLEEEGAPLLSIMGVHP
jgi:hypothetical protein